MLQIGAAVAYYVLDAIYISKHTGQAAQATGSLANRIGDTFKNVSHTVPWPDWAWFFMAGAGLLWLLCCIFTMSAPPCWQAFKHAYAHSRRQQGPARWEHTGLIDSRAASEVCSTCAFLAVRIACNKSQAACRARLAADWLCHRPTYSGQPLTGLCCCAVMPRPTKHVPTQYLQSDAARARGWSTAANAPQDPEAVRLPGNAPSSAPVVRLCSLCSLSLTPSVSSGQTVLDKQISCTCACTCSVAAAGWLALPALYGSSPAALLSQLLLSLTPQLLCAEQRAGAGVPPEEQGVQQERQGLVRQGQEGQGLCRRERVQPVSLGDRRALQARLLTPLLLGEVLQLECQLCISVS